MGREGAGRSEPTFIFPLPIPHPCLAHTCYAHTSQAPGHSGSGGEVASSTPTLLPHLAHTSFTHTVLALASLTPPRPQGTLASAAGGKRHKQRPQHLRGGALHAAKKRLREMQHERDRQRGRKVGCVDVSGVWEGRTLLGDKTWDHI